MGSPSTSRVCVERAGSARAWMIAHIPVHPAATRAEALGGGEDYELLATLPDLDAVEQARSELREAFGVSLSDIGAIIEAKGAGGLVAVDEDGTEAPLIEGTVEGWDHFR